MGRDRCSHAIGGDCIRTTSGRGRKDDGANRRRRRDNQAGAAKASRKILSIAIWEDESSPVQSRGVRGKRANDREGCSIYRFRSDGKEIVERAIGPANFRVDQV